MRKLRGGGRGNTMMTIALIDGILYAGVSIVVFVGILTMGMGVVAGR
jgi:hypothetical protein